MKGDPVRRSHQKAVRFAHLCRTGYFPQKPFANPEGQYKSLSVQAAYLCAINKKDQIDCWGVKVPDSPLMPPPVKGGAVALLPMYNMNFDTQQCGTPTMCALSSLHVFKCWNGEPLCVPPLVP